MIDIKVSKYISLILRHKPETIGIKLDEHGWADVDELIAGVARTHDLNRMMLEEIVAYDDKQRFAFNADKTKIRANQGHSIMVDVELVKTRPLDILWHGTAKKYEKAIDNEGLIAKNRLYVHLSNNKETAYKVGKRHGKPLIYEVDANRMYHDGYEFFLSLNGVWLTKAVPACYLKKMI